jgi:hypothetical protein
MGPWGPLREEGVSPLGLGAKGGAHHPPWPAHSPPWEFSPTWGRGGGWHPPLAYIRRGRPPFFQHTNISFFLLLLPGSGLPLFGVCTWIGVLHHKAGRRSAGVGIRSRLSSAARLVRGPGGTSIVPYVYNLFEALHLWCYFVAGGLPGVILAGGGLLHDREVVVLSLRQPRSQERFPLSVFKGMNTDSLRYFTSP